MALIGQIRKNSWILIVMIALGLGGFIIMDMFSGQTSIFGSSQTTIGEIRGRKVDWNEFSRTMDFLYSGGDYSSRDQLWNFFVEQAIIKDEAEDLGLGVSKEELLDLQFGPDNQLSPIMLQRYNDPVNRRQQLDQLREIIEKNLIGQYVQQGVLSPDFRRFWAHQEKEIIKERLQAKLVNLIGKAMYTPGWMAQMIHNENNRLIDFAYVQIPFDEVDDSEVQLSDSDYKDYLKENKGKFYQEEETRTLGYVSFDVIPTPRDSTVVWEKIDTLVPQFAETDDDSLFVEIHFGTIQGVYSKKGELSPAIADTVFSMDIGTVYGPYEDQGAYKAVKVLDKITIPDSVKSRHILRAASTSDPQSFVRAKAVVDSLKNLIETGVESFDSLVVKFSEDPGSKSKGGVYDFTEQGKFVPEFNNYLFFDGEPGELGVVATDFGVHLIEVLDRKYITNEEGVKLAYISEPIVPGKTTQNEIQQKAVEFLGNNLLLEDMIKSAEANQDLRYETTNPLKRNDYVIFQLGSSATSRDVIRWAFNSKTRIGDVSSEIYIYEDPVELYTNKYVIVGLEDIRQAGEPSLEDVREEIEGQVRNLKKADIIKERISSTDLQQIASRFETEIDTAKRVSFSTGFTAGLGREPKVISQAFMIDQNSVSDPIAGENGVYVIKLLNKPPATEPENIAQIRKTSSLGNQGQLRNNLMQAMKKEAVITDNRFRFY